MRLGEVANAGARQYGKPLDGVRVLAVEQMQALPYATQLMARLGAEIVKVEHPIAGESGRGSRPAMTDPEGRDVGATYLRNNLNKRSVGLDLKSDEGRDLFLRLVPNFDVVAENMKPGTMDRLGVGFEVVARHNPRAVFLSISGFGNLAESPYRSWPAYASIVEGMSGIYQWTAGSNSPPSPNPMGAIGDISSALFGVIGVLCGLRQRDRTGEGQYVDIAMLDAMVAMTDVVTHLWSMGVRPDEANEIGLITGFRCSDGYVVVQMVREPQFEALCDLVGHPEWKTDSRFSRRSGWVEHCDDTLRPAVEAWAAHKTKLEATDELTNAGVVAGPSNTSPDVIADPHIAMRNMLVEVPRPDGGNDMLVPGSPVKMSKVTEGPETRMPWVGEHTDEVLRTELSLGDDELTRLRNSKVIT